MRCGLNLPFGLSCALDYGHRGHCMPNDEEARKALSMPAPALCGVVSNSGPNGEPLACGFTRGHGGAHAWATLPTFGVKSTELPQCGWPDCKEKIDPRWFATVDGKSVAACDGHGGYATTTTKAE